MDQSISSLIQLLEASLERERQKDTQLAELQEKINKLLSQMAWLQRKLFGRVSEKYPNISSDPGLFDTFNQELISLSSQSAAAQEIGDIEVAYTRKSRNPRKDSMEGLPVIEQILEPEGIDLSKYRKMGEEHTKTIEYEPGKLYVLDIIRPKYALIDQEKEDTSSPSVVIAPMPLLPIYKGAAGSTLLAELLLQKYVHHLPFYRQIKQFRELGIKLSASTISDWFGSSCELLRPLYAEIRRIVLSTSYIQVDETILPVINRDKKKADKEYLWMARAVKEKLLFFDYKDGSRSTRAAREIIGGFKGWLQTDGYNAYKIFEQEQGITMLNCWAHCRRNYEAALIENKKLAEFALGQIQLLYKLERTLKEKNFSPSQIQSERERLALPIIKSMEKWIEENYKTVLPQSRLGKAMAYNYGLLPGLTKYIYNGELEIDNNLAENAIRPITLSRKNFLFCGNHNAASNAAIIFTLAGCCREQNINTRQYLIDILNRLPYLLDKKESLSSLIPDQWISEHPYALLSPNSSKIT